MTNATSPGPNWVKIKDFEHISFWLSIQNSITNTKIKDNTNIELTELRNDGIKVRLPAKFCSIGHSLIMSIGKKNMRPGQDPSTIPVFGTIDFTAKVIGEEDHDKVSKVYDVQFYQMDTVSWNVFLKEYADRQARMDKIFTAIKG